MPRGKDGGSGATIAKKQRRGGSSKKDHQRTSSSKHPATRPRWSARAGELGRPAKKHSAVAVAAQRPVVQILDDAVWARERVTARATAKRRRLAPPCEPAVHEGKHSVGAYILADALALAAAKVEHGSKTAEPMENWVFVECIHNTEEKEQHLEDENDAAGACIIA